MKKEFILSVNYGKYLAFALATICVLVCQFTGNMFWITCALSFYVVAFGLMFASLVIHSVEICNAEKIIKKKHLVESNIETNEEGSFVVDIPSELKGEEVEKVSLKSEKFWAIFGSIFFGLFTVFTFIVLILF